MASMCGNRRAKLVSVMDGHGRKSGVKVAGVVRTWEHGSGRKGGLKVAGDSAYS